MAYHWTKSFALNKQLSQIFPFLEIMFLHRYNVIIECCL